MPSKNSSIIALILFQCLHAHAFFHMGDYYNESIFQSTKKKKTWNITTAYGIGSQNNTLSINSEHSLHTTNRNFFILAANLDSKSNLQIFMPFKDPKSSTDARVNSENRFISLNSRFTDNIFASIDFVKNRGFYLEDSKPSASKSIFSLPNLGLEKLSLSAYYLTNTKHQSLFIEPLVLKRGQDSQSWVIFVGYNHARVSGLSDLNLLPKSGQFIKSTLANYSDINSIDSRAAYSGNWFWNNWYISASVGVGFNYNLMNIQYLNGSDKTDSRGHLNSLLSFSNGYFWTNSSISWFVTTANSIYQVDDLNLQTDIGKTGLYLSYQF